MLFKNKAFLVSLVNKNNNPIPTETEVRDSIDPERINMIAKDFVSHAAVTAVGVLVVAFALSTLSQVIVNAAKPRS
jgi:hypothetical protein